MSKLIDFTKQRQNKFFITEANDYDDEQTFQSLGGKVELIRKMNQDLIQPPEHTSTQSNFTSLSAYQGWNAEKWAEPRQTFSKVADEVYLKEIQKIKHLMASQKIPISSKVLSNALIAPKDIEQSSKFFPLGGCRLMSNPKYNVVRSKKKGRRR